MEMLRLGVGDIAKISYYNLFIFHDFIMILCHVCFNILSEQCSQNNFPTIKTKHFKVKNKIKNNGGYLGQSGQRYKSLSFYLLLKIRTKIHII